MSTLVEQYSPTFYRATGTRTRTRTRTRNRKVKRLKLRKAIRMVIHKDGEKKKGDIFISKKGPAFECRCQHFQQPKVRWAKKY
jgi:hypothetical protein